VDPDTFRRFNSKGEENAVCRERGTGDVGQVDVEPPYVRLGGPFELLGFNPNYRRIDGLEAVDSERDLYRKSGQCPANDQRPVAKQKNRLFRPESMGSDSIDLHLDRKRF